MNSEQYAKQHTRIRIPGESGSNARYFDALWATGTLNWAHGHGVAFWMKQGGSNPSHSFNPTATDRKCKELENMPPHLRVREMPR